MSLLRKYIRSILNESPPSWPSITPARHKNSMPITLNAYQNQDWNMTVGPDGGGHVDASPLKAACCFIQRSDGKILGVSRRDDPTAMGLPGGKVDPGETVENAAARELKEETGLEAVALRPVFTWCPPSEDYETTTFVCDVEDLDTIETSEEGRIKWVTWDELLAGPFGEYNAELRNVLE